MPCTSTWCCYAPEQWYQSQILMKGSINHILNITMTARRTAARCECDMISTHTRDQFERHHKSEMSWHSHPKGAEPHVSQTLSFSPVASLQGIRHDFTGLCQVSVQSTFPTSWPYAAKKLYSNPSFKATILGPGLGTARHHFQDILAQYFDPCPKETPTRPIWPTHQIRGKFKSAICCWMVSGRHSGRMQPDQKFREESRAPISQEFLLLFAVSAMGNLKA